MFDAILTSIQRGCKRKASWLICWLVVLHYVFCPVRRFICSFIYLFIFRRFFFSSYCKLFVLCLCQSTIIIAPHTQTHKYTHICMERVLSMYKTCLMMLYPTSFNIQRFALLRKAHKFPLELWMSMPIARSSRCIDNHSQL